MTIPEDIAGELAGLLDEAVERLGHSPRDADPDEVQRLIYSQIDSVEATDDKLVLGAAWGESARRALGWNWIWLADVETLGIAPADERHLVMPLQLLAENAAADLDHRNCLLLYNMLKESELPPAEPGQQYRLG